MIVARANSRVPLSTLHQRQDTHGQREIDALNSQAAACRAMGSPFYATLLELCATRPEGVEFRELLASRPSNEDLQKSVTALRAFATAHRLALDGRAPALAVHYSSCGGDGDAEAALQPLLETIADHREIVLYDLEIPVQTNEIWRAAPLLAGFLHVSERFELPLRLLEIGSSAGLILRWDHLRYEAPSWSWGPAAAGVRLTRHFPSGDPPFSPTTAPRVVAREGCDLSPIDPTTAAGRNRLLSFVWPDQAERIATLRAACELACRVAATVEPASAASWLSERLREPHGGEATVVFHSVFRQYLSDDEAASLKRVIAEAATRATMSAPIAYLTFEGDEPGSGDGIVSVQYWPPGETLQLARASFHGLNVRWM